MDPKLPASGQSRWTSRDGPHEVPSRDDLPRGGSVEGSTSLGEAEPGARIDGHEVVTLNVGKSSQDLKVEGVVHRGQPATRPELGTLPARR